MIEPRLEHRRGPAVVLRRAQHHHGIRVRRFVALAPRDHADEKDNPGADNEHRDRKAGHAPREMQTPHDAEATHSARLSMASQKTSKATRWLRSGANTVSIARPSTNATCTAASISAGTRGVSSSAENSRVTDSVAASRRRSP